MDDARAEDWLRRFRRWVKQFGTGLLSADEMITLVFDSFAARECVYPSVIPVMWSELPDALRGEFEAALQKTSDPGFRRGAFFFGGGRLMTDDELRRDSELRTQRIRAWAGEIIRFTGQASAGE